MTVIPMRTTTIEVDGKEIDYGLLTSKFQVVRYGVPKAFRFSRDPNKYARLHTEVKQQLPYPYYFFTHDDPSPGLYTLPHTGVEIPDLELQFLGGAKLEHSRCEFQRLRPHVLLKLLLADYFQSRRTKLFSAHGCHYIQAKDRHNLLVCMEIELMGDRTNEWLFKIVGHAANFVRTSDINPRDKYLKPYFAAIIKGGQTLLRPLLPTEVDGWKGDIYRIFRRSDRRATLDYHETLRYEETRGAILHRFIGNFTQYLQQHGIAVAQRVRQFQEYKPSSSLTDLPISNLRTVYLFDNRLNQETVPLSDYCTLLNSFYGPTRGLSFETLTGEEYISPGRPMLVIQDYTKKDFGPGAVLEGLQDPYQAFYETHQDIPKQSININFNEGDQYVPEGARQYLDYPLVPLGKGDEAKQWDQQLQVCFNQLYLKNLILNRGHTHDLPYLEQSECSHGATIPLHEYAFVRRATVDSVSYTTLLYMKDDHLHFVDLRSPEGKEERDALLNVYRLDWYDDVAEPFRKKYFGNSEEKAKRYDFIIGPDQVIEIEDIQERVLYDYDTINTRYRQLKRDYPVEELKLVPHAARILPQHPSATSVTLEQLEAYDAFLDGLRAEGIREVSYHKLTTITGPYRDRIIQVFDIRPNKNGRYSMSKLKQRCYQRRGMFLSAKSKDVIAGYQGIWYDEENCFMIGSADSLNQRQPRAHLIRCFDIYKGEDKFDIQLFLDTMAVKFVRYMQFTVYPYFFHLINMFVDMQLDDLGLSGEAATEVVFEA